MNSGFVSDCPVDESVQSDGLTPPRPHIDEGRRRRSHRKQTEEEEVKTDFELTRFTAFTVLDCHLLVKNRKCS
ncbi:hypothetical protein INR49_002834 [Caranx melampygus]|nr:hypothetical protein INR49_002834 [Caranx melampygus]